MFDDKVDTTDVWERHLLRSKGGNIRNGISTGALGVLKLNFF
jgi:hypothetical protein